MWAIAMMIIARVVVFVLTAAIAGCASQRGLEITAPTALDSAKSSGLPGLSDLPLIEVERRVAEGDVKALVELGTRYGAGNGVEQNADRALGYLRAAAAKNDPDAQFAIGTAFSTGRGVEYNEVAAIEWYQRAAAQGHPAAQYWLAVRIINGVGGISPTWSGAIPYLWGAAVKGYPDAEFMLGYAYHTGNGVPPNPRAAAYWYRRNIGHADNPRAQLNLGYLIRQGKVNWEEGDSDDFRELEKLATEEKSKED
jgi:TPR repeat protein